MKTMPSILLVVLSTSLIAQVPESGAAVGHPLLESGPMVGHATETTCTIWVRTRRPANVQIIARAGEGEASTMHASAVVQTTAATDRCAHVTLERLPFGTRFTYELRLNGEPVKLSWPLAFQTQPHWRWRTDPPEFSVALGSCRYVNEPRVDRPGRPYGDAPGMMRTIARAKPDLMLWLGDNVYFREPDWTSRSGMLDRYAYDRSTAELQPLLGATHHYAVWDDHDYGADNSDRTNPLKREALALFERFWAQPRGGLDGTPGIFTRFTWGDAEFFLLDGRYHRSPEHAPVGPEKRQLGRVQMRWLLDALQASDATFKVVVSGGQVLNRTTRHECLFDYPVEYEELLSGIAQRRVPGVFFVSGDRHHAELLRLPRPGSYPLHDLTTSPLSAGAGSGRGELNNPLRVPGSLLTGTRNHGMLRFVGRGAERRVVLSLHDREGRERFRHVLRAVDLRD